jgi:predicted transposase/invertase (TIGR01784 family)
VTDPEKRALINEIVSHEEGIAMAGEELLTISRDELERARLESQYKYELDRQCDLVDARRSGEEDGRAAERRETARRLRAMGMSPDQIAKATGLAPEETV